MSIYSVPTRRISRQDHYGKRSVLRVGQLRFAWSSPEWVVATSLCQSAGRYPPPHGIWKVERRVCARIEATELGLDIRYVVTNIANGSPEHIYDTLYCARGQMENLIKLHKSQLASDRTSCRAPLANQMRLILHTAAYWLMLELRDAIPKTHPLSVAEFVTLREKLLKIGARIVETASRIKLALASACPQARLFRHLAGALQPAGP